MTFRGAAATHRMTGEAAGARGLPRVLVWPAGVVLIAHGLIHLMGTALQWRIGEVGDLRYADAAATPGSGAGIAVGLGWLAAAVLIVVAGILLLARRPRWRGWALIGTVVSVAVIALHPAPAVAGLVVDGLVLLLLAGTGLADRRTVR